MIADIFKEHEIYLFESEDFSGADFNAEDLKMTAKSLRYDEDFINSIYLVEDRLEFIMRVNDKLFKKTPLVYFELSYKYLKTQPQRSFVEFTLYKTMEHDPVYFEGPNLSYRFNGYGTSTKMEGLLNDTIDRIEERCAEVLGNPWSFTLEVGQPDRSQYDTDIATFWYTAWHINIPDGITFQNESSDKTNEAKAMMRAEQYIDSLNWDDLRRMQEAVDNICAQEISKLPENDFPGEI